MWEGADTVDLGLASFSSSGFASRTSVDQAQSGVTLQMRLGSLAFVGWLITCGTVLCSLSGF